jgi:hypothetical protein
MLSIFVLDFIVYSLLMYDPRVKRKHLRCLNLKHVAIFSLALAFCFFYAIINP